MNPLQTFQLQSHQLTVITDEFGASWFIAKEVAEILEYSDAEAMTRKLDDDEVQNLQIVGLGPDTGGQGVNIINESGLWSSVLRSANPEAKTVKKWLTSEVLPAIHKTGSYTTAPALPSRDYETLQNKYIALLEQENARLKALASPPVVRFGQHRCWTLAQDQELLELKAQGLGYTAIGAKVGRSRENCRYRYNVLMAKQGGEL
ncbi:MAG TPA: BRO family protein [Methylobacter sp.]|jgi:prophage antirepressor-like protein